MNSNSLKKDDEKSININDLMIKCKDREDPRPLPGNGRELVCKEEIVVSGAEVSSSNSIAAAIIFDMSQTIIQPSKIETTADGSKLKYTFTWSVLNEGGDATVRLVEINPKDDSGHAVIVPSSEVDFEITVGNH